MSNRNWTWRRRIWKDDGYNTIYQNITNPKHRRYFLRWNNRLIDSKDLDEKQMFDYKDNIYIQWKVNKRSCKSKRHIWPQDWYHAIRQRITNLKYRRYFLDWNKQLIESKDLDEKQMFNDKDNIYINKINYGK